MAAGYHHVRRFRLSHFRYICPIVAIKRTDKRSSFNSTKRKIIRRRTVCMTSLSSRLSADRNVLCLNYNSGNNVRPRDLLLHLWPHPYSAPVLLSLCTKWPLPSMLRRQSYQKAMVQTFSMPDVQGGCCPWVSGSRSPTAPLIILELGWAFGINQGNEYYSFCILWKIVPRCVPYARACSRWMHPRMEWGGGDVYDRHPCMKCK